MTEPSGKPIGALAAVAAGVSGIICPSVSAAVHHAVVFDLAESVQSLGGLSNVVLHAHVPTSFPLGRIEWSSTLTPLIAGTRADEARVLVTSPGGLSVPLRLADGGAFASPIQVDGFTDAFAGEDPQGTWRFEFYESFDDGPGADARWSDLAFALTDDLSGLPSGTPDLALCRLSNLTVFGTVGSTLGLSLSTTALNIGNRELDWHARPDGRHPFLTTNLYRHAPTTDRFEQIGLSWCKHEFSALNSAECGDGCHPTDVNTLGDGCTDTSSASVNASQANLGPRYEVNPWRAAWAWNGSVFDPRVGGPSNNGIRRRLQVSTSDLQTPLASYFIEAAFLHRQDGFIGNNAAWKPVAPVQSGAQWVFQMSDASTPPIIGRALDAWSGAMQTVIAQELPPIPGVSPDGRAILAAKAVPAGSGLTRYEYALLNIDMDRQIGAFSVPIAGLMDISGAGFSAPIHHDEPINTLAQDGILIDNDPWDIEVTSTHITWSTSSNPLRWGTMHNFWFETAATPSTGEASIGLFRPGTPGGLAAATIVPFLPPPVGCEGDADGDGAVNLDDVTFVVLRLGHTGTPGAVPGDVDHNGVVNADDITFVLLRLNLCP